MCLALPGRVREIYESHGLRTGRVDFGGVTREVCLEYVPELGVGDYAIVHAGVAIGAVDEASALETLRLMTEAGMLDGELPAGPVPCGRPAHPGDPA
jgi:hydrogenase expression/formation protein HypC